MQRADYIGAEKRAEQYKTLARIRVLRDLIMEVPLTDSSQSLSIANLEELTRYTGQIHKLADDLKREMRTL